MPHSVDPSTGELLATYTWHTQQEVEHALKLARSGSLAWRSQPVEARCALLVALADALTSRRDALATLMAREMGKPITQGRAEVDKCAWICRFYAEHAPAMLSPQGVDLGAGHAQVRFDPLGAILAIMPWNFPLWQLFRFAAPTLAAGNVVLLKHAPNVFGCADAIAQLFEAAGAPAGVFASLRIDTDQAAALIRDPRVAGVTLTGSTRAGRAVGALAGAAIKPCVLELGGADPFIVLADADLEAAARVGARSRLLNSGQSCIAAKRFIVEAPAYKRFAELLAEELRRVQPASPLDEHAQLGPLARADLRDALHGQVERACGSGATLLLGGAPIDGPGFFYPPTLLDGVSVDNPIAQEETFGPVASLMCAADVAEAIAIANATELGLGAAIWSADVERAWRELVPALDAGCVALNDMVKSDPRLPFGGVKTSGVGRELGREGALAFTNVRAVWTSSAVRIL
jgi:succinate-semialdehyde dehydrogenase/glutarate-semialdehyde dehydrogenase